MPEAPRITPPQAREMVSSGRALLVCAYDDEERCRSMRLKGALSLQQFKERLPLPKDEEIVFYCA